MFWRYEKRRTPKAVPGATRKIYGTTWWGKKWLQVFENIDFDNRLPRGKTYANKGLAHDLDLQGNTIRAKVEGSMPKPYSVQITIPVFAPETRRRLLRIVTENPLFLSKLLNRELPPELNDACEAEGVRIFPGSWNDVQGHCSCPDWAIPCKHMAAVLFLIANEIDKNPFVIFDLHDFDLVAALRESGYGEAEHATTSSIPGLSSIQQEKTNETSGFRFEEEKYQTLDFSVLPECRDDLLRLLTDKPVFYPEGDFKKLLAAAYKKNTEMKVTPAIDDRQNAALLLHTESVMLLLDAADGRFSACYLLNAQDETEAEFEHLTALCAFLETLPEARIANACGELRSLHLAYRLAEQIMRRGAWVPQIWQTASGERACFIRFVPALLNEQVRAVCEQAATLLPPGIVTYLDDAKTAEPVPADAFNALLSVFIGHHIRENNKKSAGEGAVPRWFFSGNPMVFKRFEDREYPKSIHLWLSRFFIAEKDFVPVFEVEDTGAYFELKVSVEDKTAPFERPIPLHKIFSGQKYARLRLEALRDLSMVADFFPPLNDLIASKGTRKLQYDEQQFVQVFFEALPVIRLFGIRVLLPKALQKLLRPALSMELSSKNKGKIEGTGLLSFASMIDFNWQIALGDQQLSPDAFLALVKNMRGIVRLADAYVFLDDKEMKTLLERLESTQRPSGPKLLQIALSGEYEGAPVRLDASIQSLIDELMRPGAVALPLGLNATLRPYQHRGFEWLYKNTQLGFGSLLADDMGLGKTLQVLCTLLRMKEDGAFDNGKKALIVAPTTLLTNWQKESARFTPGLRMHLYHGPNRSLAPLAEAEVLLTTYAIIRSEGPEFQQKEWLVTVIDEAQNIKNLETAQSKAVKKLKSSVNIAMSGTPVENRLSEYFSIFEFANRGYLGNLKSFTEEIARPIEIERNHAVLERFRRITAPFLLRRLKTDKNIIGDLPDKIEIDRFCSLEPQQAALYQNVVETSLQAVEKSGESGIERRGLVLKMITALKQVCNHPAHYLKRSQAEPALSGKTQLLLELMSQILENGEKTLIFTQYREMGDLLTGLLQRELGLEPAFLHGGLTRLERDRMVDAFQNNRSARVLILSLKAGGTGLNLTAASNVIHYDLWWNPAVEAQATDRAFRIGQHRNVQVHRFITQGTFEEKINAMLQSKKALADLAVTAGEKWIGELSNGELRELLQLNR